MSLATASGCACPTPVTTEVPGPTGANGTNGTNGWNAFSILQANFIVPAINSSVTVTVDQAEWMVVGQNVFVAGAGYFQVNSIVNVVSPGTVTLTYLNYVGNTNAGNTIAAGSQISPAGTQPTLNLPLSISNGGTGASSQSGAQSALGLGQSATAVAVSGLTQALTNTATLIAGATVTVPTTGLYLVLATGTVDITGATWASKEAITLKVVDTTAASTLATTVGTVEIVTTTPYPSFQYQTPPVTATLTAADVLQVQIQIGAAPSAGSCNATAAALTIVPLAL